MENCSDDSCRNCSYLTGSNNTPPHLLRYAIVHCCSILVFGAICNVVALWCVFTCTKTRPGVKILLCSMLATTLIMCLTTMPLGIEIVLSELLCDPTRMSIDVLIGLTLLYTIMVQMELFYIAALALLRAIAVWCPQRHTVEVRVSVAIVVSICIYSIATTLGVLTPFRLDLITDPLTMVAVRVIYCFLHSLLPVLFTLACYLSMMIAVRRNKRRLASSQHNTKCGRVIDQATRAMLAVFVSNVLLSLPHSIYHVFRPESFTLYLIIHVIFFLHIVVDPFVYVWFNLDHRQRVLGKIRAGLEKIRCRSSAASGATSVVSLESPLPSIPSTGTDQ